MTSSLALSPSTRPRSVPPQTLLAAFMRYERALMANEVPVLDELFADAASTVRSDGGRAILGFEQIAAFRAGRATPPARWLEQVFVSMHSAALATVVAQSVRADGGRGVQTQVWQLVDGEWKVITAHVSTAPREPAPRENCENNAPVDPVDPSIWRVPASTAQDAFPLPSANSPSADSPSAGPLSTGPLSGTTFAIKDLFAVAGHQVGAGNPTWLAQASVEPESAPPVAALLNAGAAIAGIAHTDELAFSLAGTNMHYGTPPNAAAPGRITGGSSSGPAAAVAAGLADIGLGTDTAGSIRVPSSYCGLFGLRTTHNAVSTDRLVGLAQSFDTVGVMTRSAALLAAANDALLPAQEVTPVTRLITLEIFDELVAEDVRLTFESGALALSLRMGLLLEKLDTTQSISRVELESWFAAFRTVQASEAWREHGQFIGHPDTITEPAVAQRFAFGATISSESETSARQTILAATERLNALLPAGTVLLLPSTAGPAPSVHATEQDIEASRAATLRLTCLASLAGLPALSVPALHLGGVPLGLCLVAAPHQDRSLLEFINLPAFGPSPTTPNESSGTPATGLITEDTL